MRTAKHLFALAAAILLASCGGSQSGQQDGSQTEAQQEPASTESAVPAATPAFLPYEEEIDTSEAEAEPEPDIRLLSGGSILPSSGGMDLLFSSTGFAGARVRIRKVFTSNILQFLQYGTYEAQYQIEKVARTVADTTLVLGAKDAPHIRVPRNYALNLAEVIAPEPGAVYHVEIRGTDPLVEQDIWESDTYFGDWDTYDYRHCFLLATDVALIAKKGDRSLDVFATDIVSGAPLRGVKIKIYDSVLQELGKGSTDAAGRVTFASAPDARYVIASSDKGSSYLALKNEKSLSTSSFDVGGSKSEGGIKAYIFGERGVWRPGDTMHIFAVVMADGTTLPASHPATAELLNPDGQVTQTLTAKGDGTNIYSFPLSTAADAPTGRWQVNVKIGSNVFSKGLRIETVKPNKLDIGLSFNVDPLVPKRSCEGTVAVRWLYGATGSKLKVNGELNLSAARTAFKGWEDYDFKDDTRSFEAQTLYYSDMTTDDEGKCRLNTGADLNPTQVPGLLNADFTLRAFEPSGEFSSHFSSWTMSPFTSYVGMRTTPNRSSWGEEYLKAGVAHKFELASVGFDGSAVSVPDLHVEVFHVDWSWWWNSTSQVASYMSGRSRELLYETHVASHDGKASFSYDWSGAPEGLYFIRVTDASSGHATSGLWEVRYNEESRSGEGSDAATRLAISLNKDKFKVGETARLSIPSSKGSRALLSLEKGGRVLRTEWIECSGGSTSIPVTVTADMLPNVYTFVTLVQPHAGTLNDAPLRLYGVAGINVEDESSHLRPVLDAPSQTRPESTLKLKVSEKDGRAMSYVIAVVDEGLLGLTSFKTPDPWKAFYAKEALRVRTWDLYDDVIGAYGGRIEQLFAIGGDDEASGTLKPRSASRFEPVVSVLGPFSIKAGKSASHSIEVPQYIGSLRAMVIATDGHAQGNTQKDISVTKPFMVQATLPRTLSVGETVSVPVTLMTLGKSAGDVKLSIKTDGPLKAAGPSTKTIRSEADAQQVEYFTVQVGSQPGIAHLGATAEAGGEKSVNSIEIDVRNPNPPVTVSRSALVDPGKDASLSAPLFSTAGSNSAEIELSSMPAINLGSRMRYLIEYPYGCVEQTVSSAFPQLYLGQLSALDEATAARCRFNVEATLRRLQSFRLADGALSYWPGGKNANLFGTAYALHFMQEAEAAGYAVPAELRNSLISWLTKKSSDSGYDVTSRAYGVYALACAGKPNRSAMNLMREKASTLPASATWLLAAAYAVDGKAKVARELTASTGFTDSDYTAFGSEDRNLAVALKLNLLLGNKEEAFKLAAEVARRLSNASHWMSTQSTSWSLCSAAAYAKANAGKIDATVTSGGKNSKLSSAKTVATMELPVDEASGTLSASVHNNAASGLLYAVLSVTGIPEIAEEKAASNGLRLEVSYTDGRGGSVNVAALERGAAFYANVKVTNTTKAAVRNISLAHKLPSGWEIQNDRLWSAAVSYPAGVDYQDVRDDAVYSFFSLSAGSSVTVPVRLIATYPGRFYLPAVSCSAMYDETITALVPGRWIEVK